MSGQIRDLYITSLWKNIGMRPSSSKRVKTTQLFQAYDILCDLYVMIKRHLLTGAPGRVI